MVDRHDVSSSVPSEEEGPEEEDVRRDADEEADVEPVLLATVVTGDVVVVVEVVDVDDGPPAGIMVAVARPRWGSMR
jgi:hypothetical protein